LNQVTEEGNAMREDDQFGQARDTGERRTRRSVLVAAGRIAVGAGLLAAGIGGTSRAFAAAQRLGDATQVTIGGASLACQAPVHVAAAQGFFRDEGLDASVVDFGSEVQQALADGTADAFMDTPWFITPPRLLSGLELGTFVVTAALQQGCGALVVRPDSSIESPSDLAGQTVAGNEFLFGTPIAATGLDPNTDISWIAAPTLEQAVSTVQEGGGPVQIMHARGFYLESAGQARTIVTNNTPPADGDYCCCAILPSRTIDGDRAKAAAMTRAMMRGANWAQQHSLETAELMVSRLAVAGENVSRDAMQSALTRMAFVPQAEAARASLLNQIDRYLRYGMPVRPSMDSVELVNRVYVPVTDELA
jgi:sulfonate transport system substrate-binding protein